MRLGPAPLRSSSGIRCASPVDYEAIKRNGYHDQGVLVVDLADPRLTWVDREELKRIGAKLYGKRAA